MREKLNGKEVSGRRATNWFDNIKTFTKSSALQLNKDTKEKGEWR